MTSALPRTRRTGLRENRSSDARARVDQRLQAAPNSPALLVLAGGAYGRDGDAAAAEAALRRAIAADPSYLDGYQALAGLFISQNRLKEAREEFEIITTHEPVSVPAHTMAAILLEQEGRPVDARKHYEQALNVDPRAAVPANNLAWLMAEGGENLDMALQLAQAAKAALPDRAEINDTLGWIYYRKGLNTLAIASLKQKRYGQSDRSRSTRITWAWRTQKTATSSRPDRRWSARSS